MKSSSKHFPVSLMQADFWKEFSEDIYLLKPNTSTDKTVQVALTRLYGSQDKSDQGLSLVLVHDTYENRISWISDYEDLISDLIKSGFSIWMFEMRGHGLSPKNQAYQKNTLNDIAQYDLPAVQQFINELTHSTAIWLGKGEGGLAILRAVEAKTLISEQIQSIHLKAMERFHWMRRIWFPFVGIIRRLFNRKSYFFVSKFPESEFRSVWKQLLREKSLFGRRKTLDGQSRIFKKLPEINIDLTFWFQKDQVEKFKKWHAAENSRALVFSTESLKNQILNDKKIETELSE